jgi:carbamoyltransferase
MTTAILGLSAFYHDSAAALVVDGTIVAAAQEERFSRVKHDPAFPRKAVEYCLEAAGLTPADLDYVAYYEKPLAKLDRLIETYAAYSPRGLNSFSMAMTVWLREKLFLRRAIRAGLGGETRARLLFHDHHESHAASAFFASPFENAAILTLDGVGEWATTTMGVGGCNTIRLTDQVRFPHSLGLLYSAFTTYCGFKVNSGEYKLMGLAPYGRPIYRDLIVRELIDLKPDGSFRLNMAYFRYPHGLTMTGPKFHALFGGPPRKPESDLDQRHMDLAASIQSVLEEAVLRIVVHLRKRTGQRSLVLAGGVALNCVANGRILRESGFSDLWIQPAAGDAGGALGAALFTWHQLLEKPRTPHGRDAMQGSLLGPSYSTADCLRRIGAVGGVARTFDAEGELIEFVAGQLAEGKVVGWFQGRMEFGPRSLGARSILGDPRSPAMQSTMNLKIKFRESFRPFAPAVLAERAHEWFALEPGQESPYMLLVAEVRDSRRLALSAEDEATMRADPDLRKRVQVARSTIPAVTHVDQSARVQTVDSARNPRFHRLLAEFERLTGCPVLVNTSFNVRGEPIVNTPEDAYLCFQTTGMDLLVIENVVVEKGKTKASMTDADREMHLARFAPD